MFLRTGLMIAMSLSGIFMIPFESEGSELYRDSVDIAGIRLGMTEAQVRALYPQILISENKAKFKGVPVAFRVGKIMNVKGDPGETAFLRFENISGKESRVLSVQYMASLDDRGSIMETAMAIAEVKANLLKKYGKPDLAEDKDTDTYLTYNVKKVGGVIIDEVVLRIKIMRFVSLTSASGSLLMELVDQGQALRQQVQWVQRDAERKARKKAKKLGF